MFDFLGDLLGLNKGKATKAAALENQDLIRGYDAQGRAIIDDGSAAAGGYLQQVTDTYSPLAKIATGAASLYGDALGVNGAGGSARATEAFQTAPGYEFQRSQGLDALDRRASAAGRFQSGNADIDAMTYATGLADQSYGSWLDRLANPGSTISGAIPGLTGALNNQANLATGTAGQKLGLAGDVTSGLMAGKNQWAQGEEANKAGIASFGSNLIGLAGKAFGWGGF